MFANVGWGEMLLLVVAGLVILGPERLPGAIRWTSGALRQARDYISGATSQLREDLGPEFDDLREPLGELQQVAGHDTARRSDQAPARRRRLDFHGQVRQARQHTRSAGSGRADAAHTDAGTEAPARDAVRQRRHLDSAKRNSGRRISSSRLLEFRFGARGLSVRPGPGPTTFPPAHAYGSTARLRYRVTPCPRPSPAR